MSAERFVLVGCDLVEYANSQQAAIRLQDVTELRLSSRTSAGRLLHFVQVLLDGLRILGLA